MDAELKVLLNNLLSNAQGHPLGDDDKRTVYATDLRALSGWYNDQAQSSDVTCRRCGCHIDMDGFCTDETCPYSDWGQTVPNDLLDQDFTTLDIFDECASLGLLVKIKDEERRAANDLFECEECGFTFDNDNSIRRNTHLYCPNCAQNYPSK